MSGDRIRAVPTLALRVIDGSGREWAPKLNGSWACLGYNLTADTLRDLDERFIVAAQS